MQRFILLLLVVACGDRGRAQAAPLAQNPVSAQARTETEPEPDVNAFQHMLRRSVVSVRAQVLSVATETLQTDCTRHVETYDVLEVFHQATGSAVSVGDDLRVDLGRPDMHPANKAVAGEEVVLFLAGPFAYVDDEGVTQSWYRLAEWPTSDVVELSDTRARWFKLSYTGHGDYLGGWGRLALIDKTRLGGSWVLCCDEATEVDANGNTRPAASVINDRALTWPEFLTMIRAAAAAEGS